MEVADRAFGGYIEGSRRHYGFDNPQQFADIKGYQQYAPGGGGDPRGESPREDYIKSGIFGTPEQCIEKIRMYAEVTGTDHIVMLHSIAGMSVKETESSLRLFCQRGAAGRRSDAGGASSSGLTVPARPAGLGGRSGRYVEVTCGRGAAVTINAQRVHRRCLRTPPAGDPRPQRPADPCRGGTRRPGRCRADLSDVDAYFCDSTAGFGPVSMVEYLGLHPRYVDSTETGGSSYLVHVGHAAAAIAAGRCQVALVTMAGSGTQPRGGADRPVLGLSGGGLRATWGMPAVTGYALAAQRHMFEFGTTSAQLAEVKVAASLHAQHNPHAFLPKPVTVEEVLDSPLISSPLHRLDCCVVTDGGGAVVVVSPEVARDLDSPDRQDPGTGRGGEAHDNGRIDLTYTGAATTGPLAFAEAGVRPADVDYVSIYDSFTITVIETLEDLGFCEKGEGGRFVLDGTLVAPDGRLPFNTDGGGLCNNHPSNRGGMTKIIEAVRQLRGEAHPAVQVPDCEIALAHGTGGSIGTRMGSATLILGREDA